MEIYNTTWLLFKQIWFVLFTAKKVVFSSEMFCKHLKTASDIYNSNRFFFHCRRKKGDGSQQFFGTILVNIVTEYWYTQKALPRSSVQSETLLTMFEYAN